MASKKEQLEIRGEVSVFKDAKGLSTSYLNSKELKRSKVTMPSTRSLQNAQRLLVKDVFFNTQQLILSNKSLKGHKQHNTEGFKYM